MHVSKFENLFISVLCVARAGPSRGRTAKMKWKNKSHFCNDFRAAADRHGEGSFFRNPFVWCQAAVGAAQFLYSRKYLGHTRWRNAYTQFDTVSACAYIHSWRANETES